MSELNLNSIDVSDVSMPDPSKGSYEITNVDDSTTAVAEPTESDKGLSTGAAIGLGVGLATGIAGVGYGIYKLIKKIKEKKEKKAKKEEENPEVKESK